MMETRFLRSESPPEGRAKYRNNIPPTSCRDWELFKQPIGFVACCLTPGTCHARTYIFSNQGKESWPVESAADEVDCFLLAQVACSGVVMVVADDLQA